MTCPRPSLVVAFSSPSGALLRQHKSPSPHPASFPSPPDSFKQHIMTVCWALSWELGCSSGLASWSPIGKRLHGTIRQLLENGKAGKSCGSNTHGAGTTAARGPQRCRDNGGAGTTAARGPRRRRDHGGAGPFPHVPAPQGPARLRLAPARLTHPYGAAKTPQS